MNHPPVSRARGPGLFRGYSFWLDPSLDLAEKEKLLILIHQQNGVELTSPPTSHRMRGELSKDKNITSPTDGNVFGLSYNRTWCFWPLDRRAPVITPEWITMSIEQGKCLSPKYYSADPEMLFSGCVVSVLQPIKTQDKELIYAGVLALGGQWRETHLSKDLTHIVALASEDITEDVRKIHGIPGVEGSTHYVTPHWVEDMFRTGRRLSETIYSFPYPPILSPHAQIPHVQEGLCVKNQPKILRPPSSLGPSKAELASSSRYVKSQHPLYRKQLLMEPSLLEAMGMGTRRTLLHLLVGCEAKLLPGTIGPDGSVESMTMADIVICQYRSGGVYERALKEGRIIGSLIWLRCILERREWISPYSQLLLYPFPTSTITGMSHCKISITNYDETSKEYLIHLIQMAGATYTATLTAGNSHLVCGATRGPKYEAASTWGKVGGMVIVNHLWLEECCQLWALQSVTRPRYQWFPRVGGVLPGLVGTTPGSPRVIRDSILEEDEKDAQGGRIVSVVLDEVDDIGEVEGDNIGIEQEKEQEEEMAKENRMEEAKEEGKREKVEKKENKAKISVSNAQLATDWEPKRRTAAKEASKALAGLMQVANEYEAQRKKEVASSKKRSHRESKVIANGQEADEDEDVASVEEEESSMHTSKEGKRRKGLVNDANPSPSRVSLVPPPIRVLFTGIKVTDKEVQGIKALGGKMAGTARDCTHLIAEAAARTEKFLVGVSVAQWIVTRAWLQDSINEGRWLKEAPYILRDQQAERAYDFSLAESLERAKKRKLFASKVIFVTGKTHPPPSTLKPLIEASGGKLVTQVSGRRVEDVGDRLMVVSCLPDRSQWAPFLERTPSLPIYSVELVLTGLLRQSLDGVKEEFRLDLE